MSLVTPVSRVEVAVQVAVQVAVKARPVSGRALTATWTATWTATSTLDTGVTNDISNPSTQMASAWPRLACLFHDHAPRVDRDGRATHDHSVASLLADGPAVGPHRLCRDF